MILITDTREQDPLVFATSEGLELSKETLDVGDYAARILGALAPVRIERKSIADLFTSFSSGYENEKAKIEKAKRLNLKLILAIEGTLFDVREGHSYKKAGEIFYSKKDGLSQVKQLYTMLVKGYFSEIWYFRSRGEMAFGIIKYFQALERVMDAKSSEV